MQERTDAQSAEISNLHKGNCFKNKSVTFSRKDNYICEWHEVMFQSFARQKNRPDAPHRWHSLLVVVLRSGVGSKASTQGASHGCEMESQWQSFAGPHSSMGNIVPPT